MDGAGDQGRERAGGDSLPEASHQIVVRGSCWGSGLADGGSPGDGDPAGGGVLTQGLAGSNPQR